MAVTQSITYNPTTDVLSVSPIIIKTGKQRQRLQMKKSLVHDYYTSTKLGYEYQLHAHKWNRTGQIDQKRVITKNNHLTTLPV